jgi:heat-inducible transcriptional repressor
MAHSDLPSRSGRILATVVREYIHTGEPVASVVIARRGSLGVSSATIRNTLARLETLGFVRQPHTSAGRVPTDRGYRFYVDLLLDARRPSRADDVAARLRRQAGGDPLHDEVLANASHLLSAESRHVGFALSAPRADASLSKIEFVSLAAMKVLVIIVAQGGQATQKVVDIGEPLDADELRRAAEYVNREFHGQPLAHVRDALLVRLREERSIYDALMRRAWDLALKSLARGTEEHTLFVEGAASLIDETGADAGMPLSALRELLALMEEKQRLIRLLSEYLDGPGLTVVIGAEHADPSLHPVSLVASPFEDGQGIGYVGVIGPTRMRYSKAIAVVDDAAHAVSQVLKADADQN